MPILAVEFLVRRMRFPGSIASHLRCVCVLVMTIVVSGIPQKHVAAQTAETLTGIRSIAVDWSGVDEASRATRSRVIKKLKASKVVLVVPQAGQADAVLHGNTTVWTIGYETPTPRSKSIKLPVYRGYASAEVTGNNGQTLWSYLVTPRRLAWNSVTNDLADQLTRALLLALRQRDAHEGSAGTAGVGGARPASTPEIELRGGGATFPAPIYRRWFQSFVQERPDVRIQYEAVGSEEGIRRLGAGQLDFGASDMPLTEEQLNQPGHRLLQAATVMGAVVPIYNVTGLPENLNLTGDLLSAIFLGQIRRWNAPEIRTINKHARLPDQEIAVIHRSDGSGTTFAWTDYLSKVSPEWKSVVGSGTKVKWPVGIGAEYNDGVAEAVQKTPNSIGYVEFTYALQRQLEFAAVRNASGQFVKADLGSLTEAVKSAAIPKTGSFGFSIANPPGKYAYPIATFTWLLLPLDDLDKPKQAALRGLLIWMLTSGQKQCESLGYVRLPPEFAQRELQAAANLQ